MQLLEHWNPLNLPRGSVRALITLTLMGVLWTLMLLDRALPLVLCYLALMALSSYFGTRGGDMVTDSKRCPLFLPRGSIRILVVVGFAVVAYFLWDQGRLTVDMRDRSAAMLVLVAALSVGLLARKLADALSRGAATPTRQAFENLKSVFVLALTAFLALVWIVAPAKPEVENLALLSAPLLVFYFGSRN